MQRYWKVVVVSVGCGVLGVLLTVASLHLWNDHQMLHAVVNFINQNATQQPKHP